MKKYLCKDFTSHIEIKISKWIIERSTIYLNTYTHEYHEKDSY